jgi:hypothetical protein
VTENASGEAVAEFGRRVVDLVVFVSVLALWFCPGWLT